MNNSVDIELQEILRNGVLSNIDINVIEHLVTDRAQLITEMNRILERIVELQNIYLNVVGQRQMAEMMADEVIGFGPCGHCWKMIPLAISWLMAQQKFSLSDLASWN